MRRFPVLTRASLLGMQTRSPRTAIQTLLNRQAQERISVVTKSHTLNQSMANTDHRTCAQNAISFTVGSRVNSANKTILQKGWHFNRF